MDPQRKNELILRRDAAKRAVEERSKVTAFKSLIAPLDKVGARYVVIPPGNELLRNTSALAALESFPFDSCGHLDSEKTIQKQDWRTVLSGEFVANRRAFIAWKGSEYCVEAVLSEILPAVEDIFIDYYWDAYLFDPFGSWIIESHHDGFLAIIGAEQGGAPNPLHAE